MDTASGDATLDSAIDALYAGRLEGFIGARNQLAAALKQRGDRNAAARIKALPKPSLSAWAVNQLWWHARPEVDTLLAAGQLVKRLQQSGAGPAEQAAAAKRRRACLDALLDAAEERLREAGHAANTGTMRRISISLEALAAWGQDVPAETGRLVDDLAPPGFEALAGLGFTAPPVPRPSAASPEGEVIELTRPVDDPRAAKIRLARQALTNAEQAASEAAREVDAAAAAADDAAATADAAEQAHRRARAEAEAATRRAEHAQASWRRDAKQADALAEAAAAARQRQRDAEAEARARRDALASLEAED